MDSPKNSLNMTDIKSVAITTGIVALTAGLTYIAQAATQMDLGMYSPLIVVGSTALLKLLQKYNAGVTTDKK